MCWQPQWARCSCSRGSKAQLRASQLSYAEGERLVGAEDPERAQYVDNSPDSDVPKQVLGSLRSSPPGFVDFSCGDRFRKGQFGVFNHPLSNQGNEQHSQDAAHGDHCGRFPVRFSETERRPNSSDRGMRE